MFRSLPFFSLLLLQLAGLSAQQEIYATYDGVLISWAASEASAAVGTLYGHRVTFGVPAPVAPTSAPAPKAHPTSSPPSSVPPPVITPSAKHHTPVIPVPAPTHQQSSKNPTPSKAPNEHSHKQPNKHSHEQSSNQHGNQNSHTRHVNHSKSQAPQSSPSSGPPSNQHEPNNQGASGQKTPLHASSSGGSNNAMAIGLGVGLGLLALIIIAGVGVFFYIRRRKQKTGYASAASSFNEEGKPGQQSAENLATQNAYALNAEPTLPSVMAAPSPRNSFSTGPVPANVPIAWSTGQPMVQASQPWAPRTPSRLSQIPETAAPAENPPQYAIPRRPVGRDSL